MRRALLTALATCAATLAACSGGDKIVGADGSRPTSIAFASADSSYLASLLSAAAWGLMKQMRTITNIQATGFGSSRPACAPTATIGGTDANGNGLPDDQTTQYSATGCTFLNNGLNTTASGSIRLQDLGGFYGYRITYNNYTLTGTKGDSVVTATLNGSYEFRYSSTTAGSALDNTTLVLRTQSAAGSFTLTIAANLSGALSPTSGVFAFNTFPGATMSLTGSLNVTLAVTGNAVVANYPSTVAFNMAVSTPTTLTSPNTCTAAPAFTAGTISAALTGTWRSTVRLAYTACGSGNANNPGTKR
jgi:hypothetical protein